MLRILLVDDNRDDRALVIHELKRFFSEVQVMEVGTAAQFEQVLANTLYDVVITDYQLRWSDGLTVLKTIKAQHPHCPVIMFTNTATQETAVEAMKSGLDDYVIKSPSHYVRLPAAVQTSLEKVATQQQAANLQARLQTLLNQLNVGVYRLTSDGVLLEANAAFLRLLGLDTLTAIPSNQTLEPYFQPQTYTELLNQLKENGEVREREILIRCADDTSCWVKISKTFTRVDGMIIIEGLMEDINDRKQAELQRQKQASELRQLNTVLEQTTEQLLERNQELDRFVYTVSHDLKAPLRAIYNLSQWIADDLEGQLEEENQHQMQLLQNRVLRMEAMINGLLAYSRVGRSEVATEWVNVGELISEILESLMLPPTFTIAVESEMPTLLTKKLLLSQVLSNLISNAIKHHNCPDDGRVEIKAIQEGEFYKFSVIDNGPGIAPEHHHRVFEIFQTLKGQDVQESTGIGLSIVKKIIEAEGGSIVLESNLCEGATFRFTWLEKSLVKDV
ncbi:ATP-binding protein [Chroococcus sp. FPU101]|uniref:sensor histidine kinase n=1 Tax=Chroococcus sp. FPU101 TaxID=1974212 RepID=UPI001A8E3F38|nr:ATP-binding protein [Chroococcus sp. FPU101]